jgi:hypothetical protein
MDKIRLTAAKEEKRHSRKQGKLAKLLREIGKEHNLWFCISDCDHSGGLATIYVAEVIKGEGGATVDD